LAQGSPLDFQKRRDACARARVPQTASAPILAFCLGAMMSGRSGQPGSARPGTSRYSPHEDLAEHDDVGRVSCPTGCVTGTGILVREESMNLVNDPRFYAENVVDKRLAAIGTLSVVASLMTATSVKLMFKLDKEIDFSTFRGVLQIIGFATQACILFFCLTATVVMIHQLLFVFRLMTSGATGFENATSFYLHKDMILWRHFAIKTLGLSLCLFLVSAGVMLYIEFDEAAYPDPKFEKKHLVPEAHNLVACIVLAVFCFQAIMLCYIRSRHLSVFRQTYRRGTVAPLLSNRLQRSSRNGPMLDT